MVLSGKVQRAATTTYRPRGETMSEIRTYQEALQRAQQADSSQGVQISRSEAAEVLQAAAAQGVGPAEVEDALRAAGFDDIAGARALVQYRAPVPKVAQLAATPNAPAPPAPPAPGTFQPAGGGGGEGGRRLQPVPPRGQAEPADVAAPYRPTRMWVRDHEPGILERIRDIFLEIFTWGRADTVTFDDKLSDEQTQQLARKAERLTNDPAFLEAYGIPGQPGAIDTEALRRDLENSLRISNRQMEEASIQRCVDVMLQNLTGPGQPRVEGD